MKYVFAYRFRGSDPVELRENLTKISAAIEGNGHETYINFRDSQQWGKKMSTDLKQIFTKAFSEISTADVFFVFVNSLEKSEGMILELGYAKALSKRIILSIANNVKMRLIESLADEVIRFKDVDDLVHKINN